MAKSILFVTALLCLFGMVPQAASSVGQAPPQAPAEDLFLVPNEQIAALPAGARIIHDYGESVLAYVPGDDKVSLPVRTRITAVPRTDQLAYRSWSGSLDDRQAAAVRPAGPGYYLLGLVGPTDQAWLEMLTSAGVQVLDSCSAPTVLVKADNAALQRSFELLTSEGYRIVRGAETVPLQARIDPELLALAHGEITFRDVKGARLDGLDRLVVQVSSFPDQSEKDVIAKVGAYAEHAAPEWAYSSSTAFFVNGPELLDVLNNIREVAYISIVRERELHNNLAPKDYILNITPVWDLGYDGTGIIVGHNDGGVNLTHPDFPSGVIIATYGAMTNTDNEHGTHTAGSVLGRGLAASSPTNTSGCGDQTPRSQPCGAWLTAPDW